MSVKKPGRPAKQPYQRPTIVHSEKLTGRETECPQGEDLDEREGASREDR